MQPSEVPAVFTTFFSMLMSLLPPYGNVTISHVSIRGHCDVEMMNRQLLYGHSQSVVEKVLLQCRNTLFEVKVFGRSTIFKYPRYEIRLKW